MTVQGRKSRLKRSQEVLFIDISITLISTFDCYLKFTFCIEYKPPSIIANIEKGETSPFKKYYEDRSLSKKISKTYDDDEDSFTGKLISLKETRQQNDYEMPYIDRKAATRRALDMWKTQREKKVILNRSEEQLMRSIRKWGDHKSKHHERQLMSSDRHSLAYNNYSRSWKIKPNDEKLSREEIMKSFNISHDQFLDTDNESLKSDEGEGEGKKTRNKNADYSFDEESHITNLMNRLHDMSHISNDHDVMFSSMIKEGNTGDDSFFLTKKNMDGDASPSKLNNSTLQSNPLNAMAPINPLRSLNRIQKLRHMKGKIINAEKLQDNDHIDTIFNTETSLKRHISLSLYTRPKTLLSRKSLNSSSYYDGDGILGSRGFRSHTKQRNGSIEPYQSSHSQHRTNQINEIDSLKYQLTGQDINCSVMTIEKAILFPQDRPEDVKTYPKIGEMLFKNPFEKKKKKKKKKGKKKKK